MLLTPHGEAVIAQMLHAVAAHALSAAHVTSSLIATHQQRCIMSWQPKCQSFGGYVSALTLLAAAAAAAVFCRGMVSSVWPVVLLPAARVPGRVLQQHWPPPWHTQQQQQPTTAQHSRSWQCSSRLCQLLVC
jgi:hypothetical protein